MISGIDITQVTEYRLTNDVDNPTVWKLGVIPSYIMAKISAEAQSREIETAYKLLQVSLRGWDNCPVPYTTKKTTLYGREVDIIPIETLDMFPISVISELAGKVAEINQLTAGEQKN